MGPVPGRAHGAACRAWPWARRRALTIAGACLGVLGVASGGRAQTIGYTASVFVTQSTYDTERVTSLYFFNGVDITGRALRLSASVPLIRQGTALVAPQTDPTTSVPPTSSGFGDPLIRLDVRVVDDRRHNLQIGVAGSVKPAIVNAANGLGTGVADFGAGATAFRAMGRTTLMADAMFWKYGDPEGADFQNSLAYSFGVGRMLGSGKWSAIVSLAGFSPIGDAPPQLLLTASVMTLAGRNQSLAITAGFGLTSSASDFSIGTSWRIQN